MVMDEKKIIDVAMEWVGTAWMHSVSLKGYRTDCAQLIVSIGKELGWIPQDYKTQVYNRQAAFHCSESRIVAEFERVGVFEKVSNELNEMRVGDILVFRTGRNDGHVGIFIGKGNMVHCGVLEGVEKERVSQFKGQLSSVWRVKA
jgi:cell wall-associated NlpC family hydrolase